MCVYIQSFAWNSTNCTPKPLWFASTNFFKIKKTCLYFTLPDGALLPQANESKWRKFAVRSLSNNEKQNWDSYEMLLQVHLRQSKLWKIIFLRVPIFHYYHHFGFCGKLKFMLCSVDSCRECSYVSEYVHLGLHLIGRMRAFDWNTRIPDDDWCPESGWVVQWRWFVWSKHGYSSHRANSCSLPITFPPAQVGCCRFVYCTSSLCFGKHIPNGRSKAFSMTNAPKVHHTLGIMRAQA